jgi:multidrug transporter EmrE-like cation transporter
MQQWLFLLAAIACEVVATTSLKLSQGFTKIVPSIVVIVGYSLSFWAVSLTMKTMPLNVVYPVWAGLGTALVVVSGMILFHEVLTPLKVMGILVVVAGIIVLNLAGVRRFEG